MEGRGHGHDQETRRAANDLLRAAAGGGSLPPTPYYCECADPCCREIVWLGAEDFDLRRAAGRPVLAPAHEPLRARAS